MELAKNLEDVKIRADELIILELEKVSFTYSQFNVRGPGCTEDPDVISFEGCNCSTNFCVPATCSCNCQNYRSGKLISILQDCFNSPPIYECNSMCKCGYSCQNRLVQKGLQVPLEVFKTSKKGLGVCSLQKIEKGEFVCEYAGEILSRHEAIQRSQVQAEKVEDMNYIITAKEYHRDREVDVTHVDPKQIGNVGRFINHCCDPNLMMIPVRVDSKIPHLALFASRDIGIGEELSFSYMEASGYDIGDKQTESRACKANKNCYCAAKECTGYLPFNSTSLS